MQGTQRIPEKLPVLSPQEVDAVAAYIQANGDGVEMLEEKGEALRPPREPAWFLETQTRAGPRPPVHPRPITQILLDVAERGRSLSVILIGAQQTASDFSVDASVVVHGCDSVLFHGGKPGAPRTGP